MTLLLLMLFWCPANSRFTMLDVTALEMWGAKKSTCRHLQCCCPFATYNNLIVFLPSLQTCPSCGLLPPSFACKSTRNSMGHSLLCTYFVCTCLKVKEFPWHATRQTSMLWAGFCDGQLWTGLTMGFFIPPFKVLITNFGSYCYNTWLLPYQLIRDSYK